jgi:hypothetical protein
MSDNNDQASSHEKKDNSQSCCDGGSCCSSGSDGSGKNWKMIVFVLIVIAAGAVLANSLIRKSSADADQSQQLLASTQTDYISPAMLSEKAETSDETKDETAAPLVAGDLAKQEMPKAEPSLWGAELDTLASLNKVAVDTDAVFILLLAKGQQSDQAITKEIEAAAQKLLSDGTIVSAFRLKESAPNYEQLAKQVSVPSVLTMVKGLGMKAVSGEITETKLVQAFVAASRPSSCGPAGCCP